MGNIFIPCHASGTRLDTGIETTAESLSRHWDQAIHIYCPHCKTDHIAVVRDAFAVEVISDFQMRGTSSPHAH
jgi:hypothetical protein